MNIKIVPYTLFLCIVISVYSRSWLHKKSTEDPYIEAYSDASGPRYTLKSSLLEWYPIFGLYDYNIFYSNLLPDGAISVHNKPKETVNGAILKNLIEKVILEIRARKMEKSNPKEYEDFTVLKNKSFNLRKQAGLLVLKFKKYPFVVKIFMENPESFVHPYQKGFEESCQFMVGGGITRHALGFSRIKNAQHIAQKIAESEELKPYYSVPRKWSWMPKQKEFFTIEGYNFHSEEVYRLKIPAVYAIIADAIDIERTLSCRYKNDRETALKITNACNFVNDAHIKNFVHEKGTGIVYIIDTEHFPSMAGLKEQPSFSSYIHYYASLIRKCFTAGYATIKGERRKRQYEKPLPFHTLRTY